MVVCGCVCLCLFVCLCVSRVKKEKKIEDKLFPSPYYFSGEKFGWGDEFEVSPHCAVVLVPKMVITAKLKKKNALDKIYYFCLRFFKAQILPHRAHTGRARAYGNSPGRVQE